MLERIIEYTLKQKGMVIFLSLLIVTIGSYWYWKLPIDAFPDVTNIQVEVVSHADGLSAIEIERNVTGSQTRDWSCSRSNSDSCPARRYEDGCWAIRARVRKS